MTPVEGVLAGIAKDRGLLIEQQEADADSGTVVWVPLDVVVAVSAAYRRRDVEAERRAQIEADAALLFRVRAVAVAHAGSTGQIGRRTVQGAT